MRLHLASLAFLGALALAGPCRADQPNAPSPLRLLPAETEFFIQIPKPHKLADVAQKDEIVNKLLKLEIVKKQLDTTTIRRGLQLLAHVEKRMGDKWPGLLSKLASGGAALGGKYGDKAPVLFVVQGDNEKATKEFAALAAELFEAELSRQESKEKLQKRTEKDHEAYQVGDGFFAARIGAALVVSNNKDARDKAIALYRGEQKKSVATNPLVLESAKLLPEKPLANAWFDMAPAHKSEEAKALYKSPRDNFQFTILAGAYLDVLGRSPYVCAALTQEKEGYSLSLRAPRGRDGMGPDKALHVPEKDGPGCLPLLAPKGVMYSTTFYLDAAKTWQDREKLFTKQSADELTKADRTTMFATLGIGRLSHLLESVGSRQRFVFVNPTKSGYKRTPKTAVQSFAVVADLRNAERFDWTMSLALRALGLTLSYQYDLNRKEERHNGVNVVGYRFDEKKEMEGDENDSRFGYSPCFARVGKSFIFCSTIELCRDLIDELQAEQKKPAKMLNHKAAERYYAAGFAQLLQGMEDQLITQAILDQAIEPAEAKKQVGELIEVVKGLGDVTSHVDFKDKETHYTFRFGK